MRPHDSCGKGRGRQVDAVGDVLELRARHSLRVCTATSLLRLHASQRVFPLPEPVPPVQDRVRRVRTRGLPVVARYLCGERQGVLLLSRRSSFDDIAAAVLAQTSLRRCSELRLDGCRLCQESEEPLVLEDGAVLEVGE